MRCVARPPSEAALCRAFCVSLPALPQVGHKPDFAEPVMLSDNRGGNTIQVSRFGGPCLADSSLVKESGADWKEEGAGALSKTVFPSLVSMRASAGILRPSARKPRKRVQLCARLGDFREALPPGALASPYRSAQEGLLRRLGLSLELGALSCDSIRLA